MIVFGWTRIDTSDLSKFSFDGVTLDLGYLVLRGKKNLSEEFDPGSD